MEASLIDFFCSAVSISVQGHHFQVNLFNLSINGANIILRVQWLKSLRLVTTDYSYLTMHFSDLGQPITLHVDVPLLTERALAQQLRCYSQTSSISILLHLTPLTTQAKPSLTQPHPNPSSPPVLITLLSQFDHLFHSPTPTTYHPPDSPASQLEPCKCQAISLPLFS